MDPIIVLGLFGAALTTFSLLPQLIKVIKTRSTKDISTGMMVLLSTAFAVWLIYGVLTGDFPLIVANVFSVLQGLVILVFKFIYK